MSAGDSHSTFESERPRLIGLAYRMLGTVSDAEDVVQDAWLRWNRTDAESIDRPAAWLTTVTSRLAIDRMRAMRRRREDYVGPWLPEPLLTSTGPTDHVSPGPEDSVETAESLTTGFLVVLDQLGDLERVGFVLAVVFGEPYALIGDAVDRSAEACRQIASRARRKVRSARMDRCEADEGLLAELVGAVMIGDVDAVLELLAPQVVLHSDGGAHRRAARRPVVGPERVARLLVNLAGRAPGDAEVAFEEVNAATALVVRSTELTMVLSAERETTRGSLTHVRIMLNPDKLTHLGRVTPVR